MEVESLLLSRILARHPTAFRSSPKESSRSGPLRRTTPVDRRVLQGRYGAERHLLRWDVRVGSSFSGRDEKEGKRFHEGSMREASRRSFVAFPIAWTVLGKVGEAFLPKLVHAFPKTLLLFNANDVHLLLTSNSIRAFDLVWIGTGRRALEDASFFYFGRTYGAEGLKYLKCWEGWNEGIDKASHLLRRTWPLAVIVAPNAPLCVLLGISNTRTSCFLTVTVASIILRIWAILSIAATFPDQIDWCVSRTLAYQNVVMTLSILVVLASLGISLSKRTNRKLKWRAKR